MKNYILLILCACTALAATAQNRIYIGSYPQIRSYYNPAVTGQQGSRVFTLYRNQWTGFEDAPKTIFAGAEFDLHDLKKRKGYQLQNQSEYRQGMRHGVGLLLLRDSFGPYSETQVNLNYGAGVSLSENLLLRWGAAVTYTAMALDGSKLTVDQENDPKYSRLLGQNNRAGKMDFNLGLALTGRDFYVGYAMHDATQGKIMTSGDAFLEEMYTRRHVATAGYRRSISADLGLVFNGLYLYNKTDEGMWEGQLKAVYQDMFWAGAGYRNNLAFTATAGLKLNNLQISYLYESPVADAATADKPSNEIALAFRLRAKRTNRAGSQLTVW